ncbi:MAG: hypothetical protein FWE16_01135 [Firmicutes bacterium]|nr:hypothetical protein [Bacillota bacterium]
MDKQIRDALWKKALGYDVPTEKVIDGELVKFRHIPPDLDAIKMLGNKSDNDLTFKTKDELIKLAQDLLNEIKGEI